MSYRDGYDFRKWYTASSRERPRRYWVRWGLLAGLVGIAMIPVFAMLDMGQRSDIVPNVVPMSMILIYSTLQSPFARDAWLAPRGFAAYDEFERTALLAAMRRAYLVDLNIVTALFIWLMAASHKGWPVPTMSGQWGAIGYATVMAMLALPIIFAEFMVPMPTEEDELL